MSNLWDSVHRGLDKASKEAGRIARIQKLRSQTDGLSRQLQQQNNILLERTMSLFHRGQLHLAQSELTPLCQGIMDLQLQIEQLQNELKLQQSQAPQQAGPATLPPQQAQPQLPTTGPYPPNSPPPYQPASDVTATIFAPPPPSYGGTYVDPTLQANVPPPPPQQGAPTISGIETAMMDQLTPPAPPSYTPHPNTQRCSNCNAEAIPGNAYCHNCGSPLQTDQSAHLPTMRAGITESSIVAERETVRASEPDKPLTEQETVRAEAHPWEQETVRASEPDKPLTEQETVRSDAPFSSPGAGQPEQKEGGH